MSTGIKMNYKVGYTVGVFDLFHVGHLNLLEKCKSMCDKLVVGICDDDYVKNIKHKEPIFNESERARIVGALKCVDEVHIVNTEITNDKMLALEKIHFDVLFSGNDWKGSERYKITEAQFAPLGVSIEYLPYTQGISTTDLVKKMK